MPSGTLGPLKGPKVMGAPMGEKLLGGPQSGIMGAPSNPCCIGYKGEYRCPVGTRVYVSSEERVWATARVVAAAEDGSLTAKLDDEETLTTIKPGDPFYLCNTGIYYYLYIYIYTLIIRVYEGLRGFTRVYEGLGFRVYEYVCR